MVKNLKKLRQERGISQNTLAQALGITQQSVNKYENHKIEPEIAIAEYFGVTVDYLVGRTGQEGNNLNLSREEKMWSKFRTLNEKKKQCVETVIDTLFNQ